MKKEIVKFTNHLCLTENTHITELSLKRDLPSLFPILVNNGFLISASPINRIVCKDCDIEHIENVIEVGNKYYTKCEYSEYASLSEVHAEELKCYTYSLSTILKWIGENLTDRVEINKEDDLVWFLGKRQDKNIYFLKTQDEKELQDKTNSINTQNNLIIWLGETSRIGFLNIEALSIQNILLVDNEDFHIQQIKSSDRFNPNKKDIWLDKDIMLTHDNNLLLIYNNSNFTNKVSIYPQAYKLIRYLYDQRLYGNSYSSKQLGDTLGLANPKTVPTRFKEINSLCEDYKVKPLIAKYPKNTWILNPNLTCFN